ncbi:MarR family transcriptional regulator, partial [Streptomyces sp. NPDC127074]
CYPAALSDPHPAAAVGGPKLLYLTEEGKQTLDDANRRARLLDEQLLEPYGPQQRDDITNMLASLADHWEQLTQDG